MATVKEEKTEERAEKAEREVKRAFYVAAAAEVKKEKKDVWENEIEDISDDSREEDSVVVVEKRWGGKKRKRKPLEMEEDADEKKEDAVAKKEEEKETDVEKSGKEAVGAKEKKRKQLTKPQRCALFQKWMGDGVLSGECFCCPRKIEILGQWHAAHIDSFCTSNNQKSTEPHLLVPTCAECNNNEQNTQNQLDFIVRRKRQGWPQRLICVVERSLKIFVTETYGLAETDRSFLQSLHEYAHHMFKQIREPLVFQILKTHDHLLVAQKCLLREEFSLRHYRRHLSEMMLNTENSLKANAEQRKQVEREYAILVGDRTV